MRWTFPVSSLGKPLYALTLGLAELVPAGFGESRCSRRRCEPEVTQMLRQVLTDLAAGKADPSHFTPAMNAALTPAVIAQTNQNLAAAGAFKPDTLAC